MCLKQINISQNYYEPHLKKICLVGVPQGGVLETIFLATYIGYLEFWNISFKIYSYYTL